jgi:hypothetical protein
VVRRLLANLLLAFSLAGAGPAAYAHSLTHLGEARDTPRQQDGDKTQNVHPCQLCAAFAGAGALGTAPELPAIALACAGAPTAQTHPRLIPCEALERFASRAPPLPA